jgi:hypothetical protein
MEAKHPIDFACNVPDVLTRNVAKVLSDGPRLVIARRKLAVLKARKMAAQLQEQEKQLHDSLTPEMAKLLEGKNLVSPKFPRGFASMLQTPDELRRNSVWMREANAAKCRPSERHDLDDLVCQQTLDERDSGWLRGPFTEEEVAHLVRSNEWLATRRFPLEQKDNVRLIAPTHPSPRLSTTPHTLLSPGELCLFTFCWPCAIAYNTKGCLSGMVSSD